MPLAEVLTRYVVGIEAKLTTIEIDISQGLPGFILIGVPDTVSRGIRARVRSAILNSGYQFPARKITLNFTPNTQPTDANGYDLPIAIAILIASGQIHLTYCRNYEYYAGLSLDGSLTSCRGAISVALAAIDSEHPVIMSNKLLSPELIFKENSIFYAESLQQVCRYLQGETFLPLHTTVDLARSVEYPNITLQTITGLHHAKRALEITASGGHSLLMVGPPGTGKTTLANCLPSLLPDLTHFEKIAIAQIESLSKHCPDWPILRPFRAPHHSITAAGLIGSIHPESPGEITLAHQGVLFLDELSEFDRKTLEALRTPLEQGAILLSRARKQVTYPARFQLVAAMNLPFCYAIPNSESNPPRMAVNKSLDILSAALIDRFQLSVEVLESIEELAPSTIESSETVRKRVILARDIQLRRQGKENARLCSNEVSRYCSLKSEDQDWLKNCINKLYLSHRAYLNVIRVARTIADLNGHPEITRSALQEALSYRYTDRIIQYLTHLYQ